MVIPGALVALLHVVLVFTGRRAAASTLAAATLAAAAALPGRPRASAG